MSFAKAFSPALREIRILCSQASSPSAGTRQFIISKYPVIKRYNPDLPVLIREATGTPARAFARFELGVEKHVELDNLSAAEVETKVGQLISHISEPGLEKDVGLHKLSAEEVVTKVGQPTGRISERGLKEHVELDKLSPAKVDSNTIR